MNETVKDRIKVLHVGLDSRLGGIETYLLKIASHVDRSRFQFDFLAFNGVEPCFYRELSSLGCGFRFVRGRREHFFGNIKDVRMLMENEKYDIVHCHLNSLSYITPALEGLRSGAKVIVHSRNGGASSGSSSRFFCLINKYLLPYDKMTLLAVSDKAGEWMFGRERRFTVLNNGIDTERYKYSFEKRQSFRKQLGIDDDREVVLHVGAFRPQKNHSLLIDIFKEYSISHPSSILVLVGTGELEGKMKDKVSSLDLQDKVLFLGQRLDLDYVLSGSDKFLFPSLYEGFPNALLEAECSGLWCVASSSITKEVMFDSTVSLGLDEPVAKWVEALARGNVANREECSLVVDEKGYGVKSEVERLEGVYMNLLGEDNG